MALSFVADENVESDVVVALRDLGHDVVDVAHTRVTSLISLTRKHARHSATRRRSAISGTRAKAAWTGQARATGAVVPCGAWTWTNAVVNIRSTGVPGLDTSGTVC